MSAVTVPVIKVKTLARCDWCVWIYKNALKRVSFSYHARKTTHCGPFLSFLLAFYLSTESVCDLSEEMLLQIQTRQFGAACPRVKLAPASATKRSGSVWLRRRNWGPKCSVAAAAQLEVKSETKTKPFPAEVSRTLMELAKVGTLCTLTEEGLPLGTGVRFAVEPEHGTPLFCFNSSANTNISSSLHVQVPHFPSLSLSVSLLNLSIR